MNEKWVDIEEFKGLYQVSNLGNVRSIERKINTRIYPSIIMKKYPHKVKNEIRGERVHLRSPKKHGQIQRSVAKLVLISFNGKPPKNAKQVIHIDGNPLNNKLDNLKWDVDKAFGLPKNIKARELFCNEIYKILYQILLKSYKSFYIEHKNDIEDIIQDIAIKIFDIIDLINFDNDKTDDDINKHFYCFCRKKTSFMIKRICQKKQEQPLICTFSDYNSMVGEDFSIEENIASEDIYEFENEINIDEFCEKYNVEKKL